MRVGRGGVDFAFVGTSGGDPSDLVCLGDGIAPAADLAFERRAAALDFVVALNFDRAVVVSVDLLAAAFEISCMLWI